MNHFLPIVCALAVLAGAVVFAGQGGDKVSFVELGAPAPHAGAVQPA